MIVHEVDPASPAADKSIKAGDVIVEVAQEPVNARRRRRQGRRQGARRPAASRSCCASRTARATCASSPCRCSDRLASGAVAPAARAIGSARVNHLRRPGGPRGRDAIACSTPLPTASRPSTRRLQVRRHRCRASRSCCSCSGRRSAGWRSLVTALDRLLLPRSRPRDAAARRAGHRPGRRAHLRPSSACAPPAELGLGDAERVSGSRSSFPSSTCTSTARRSPGRIVRSIYVPGSFLNAAVDKASEENERRALVIDDARRRPRSPSCRSPG